MPRPRRGTLGSHAAGARDVGEGHGRVTHPPVLAPPPPYLGLVIHHAQPICRDPQHGLHRFAATLRGQGQGQLDWGGQHDTLTAACEAAFLGRAWVQKTAPGAPGGTAGQPAQLQPSLNLEAPTVGWAPPGTSCLAQNALLACHSAWRLLSLPSEVHGGARPHFPSRLLAEAESSGPHWLLLARVPLKVCL